MADIKLLDYSFLVDAIGSFTTVSEFEKFFMDFLDSRNLSGEIISPMTGSKDRRVMYITRRPTVVPEVKQPVGRPQSIKGKIKQLSHRKFSASAIQFMKGK